jgi:hypothetical protein
VNQGTGPVTTQDYEGLTPGLFSMMKFNASYPEQWQGIAVNVLFKTHYVFR